MEIWREYASEEQREALPRGHYLVEERPIATAEELIRASKVEVAKLADHE